MATKYQSSKRKRGASVSQEKEGNSVVDSKLQSNKRPKLLDSDFICPVCFEVLSEVYVTICGHSFCYRCIKRHLNQDTNCPVCNFNLPRQNGINPNFSLNDVVTKYRQQQANSQAKAKVSTRIQDIASMIAEVDNKDYPELLSLMETFKQTSTQEAETNQQLLLLDFLKCGVEEKAKELDNVECQYKAISSDLKFVQDSQRHSSTSSSNELLQKKKIRIHSNFRELLDNYVKMRLPVVSQPEKSGLQVFSTALEHFTSYSDWQELSSLTYGDKTVPCSIVSSIEFDRDGEVFAVAGVTRKIKVFLYATVLKSMGFYNHYPSYEMVCDAKLSSVCFNPYHKAILASADYEGCVSVWDINVGCKKATHHEHNKRVWSVVYNTTEPTLYASGSDDSTVKLWCSNRQQSVFTLDTKANVCSVQFHPLDRYYLAFGSADHSVHYRDLRNPAVPLYEMKGHRKAVSYVQFISESEIVSASTDSELKLWDVKTGTCKRTYKGHTNEKNFVGLTTSSDYIACGSEDNSVYVYCKHVSKPMLSYKFNASSSLMPDSSSTSQADQTESSDFVSAVCWKKSEDVILAANSQGYIKVLQLC